MMEKFPITPAGYAKVEEELKKLKKTDRPEIIQAISEARDLGDLSENAEYHAARERQAMIEARISHLESTLGLAEIIDPTSLGGDRVTFGAHVKLVDCDTDQEQDYQIVGDIEADFDAGKISINAPLARELLGKMVEDAVEVDTPSGIREYEILNIRFG